MSRKKNRKNRQNNNAEHVPFSMSNFPRTEHKRGGEWKVRDVLKSAALKVYRCPGCSNDIPVGQSHVVVWQADHFFGQEYGVEERRHWHTHCWKQS